MANKELICAGNWKLNKDPDESKEFLAQLRSELSAEELKSFALFLPATNLFVGSELKDLMNYGPQNIFWENSGAYTGEISAKVCAKMGSTLALIGHSERRQLFGETNEQTALKVKQAQQNQLIPILCVGETLEQREAGSTNDVIAEQLRTGLKELDKSQGFWLAYEPVWAIGTGKVATPDQAEAAHFHLRKVLAENILETQDQAEQIPILYGGSVKPDNSEELAGQNNINGFLIGGASLKVESFVAIYKNGRKAIQ